MRQPKVISEKETKSIIFWFVMAFLLLFLIIAPYSKGLFNGQNFNFEGPIYSWGICSTIMLFILSFYSLKNWKLVSFRDLLSMLIWLLPLSYFISSFGAVSPHLAINEVFIRVFWVIFFLVGAFFAASQAGSKTIQFSLIASGYILVIYGFLNWLGNANYNDAILQGNRLSNVLQYPNAYASYLLAMLISTLILINTIKKWYWVIIPSLMIVPVILSLLLTLSRGALLIMPILLILYLLFQPWIKQIITLLYITIAGSVSLLLFNEMTLIREKLNGQYSTSQSIKGWLLVVGASILVAVILLAMKHYVARRLGNKLHQDRVFSWKNFVVPIIVTITAIIICLLIVSSTKLMNQLPKEIQSRIEGVNSDTSNVFSRRAFNEDAIRIVNENPVFGTGGGAWSVLYESYKSYPYSSSQAHNFLIQTLVEVGYVGVIILLALIGLVLFSFIRYSSSADVGIKWDERRLIFPLTSIAILGHSLIDFDMSFVFLAAIVFLTLGASVSTDIKPMKIFMKFSELIRIKKIDKGYSILLAVIAIVCFVFLIPSQIASSKFNLAIERVKQTGNYAEFKQPLNSALKMKPDHPDYVLFKADILRQLYQQTNDSKYEHEAWELINSIEKREPNNKSIIEIKFALYSMDGDLSSALEVVTSALEKYPWDLKLYNNAIFTSHDLASKALAQGNQDEKVYYLEQAITVYNKLKEQNYHFDQFRDIATKNEKKSFYILPQIALSMGKIYFEMDKFDDATNALELGRVSSDFSDELNREIARWYIAVLKIQNKDDEGLLPLLLAADNSEKEKIEEIVERKMK